MVDPKLYIEHKILIPNINFSCCPKGHTRPSTALICVPSSCIQFVLAIGYSINVVIGELGSLVVEAGWVGEKVLERWHRDLVPNSVAVDRVELGAILNLKGPVVLWRQVKAARGL